MLPSENRLRRPAQFRSVLARGQRARRGQLVIHLSKQPDFVPAGSSSPSVPIVGFVVGRAVGNSVVRHGLTRRLRAQMYARLSVLPAGSATVVRALPGAGQLDSASLGRELDAALARLR